MRSHQLKIYYEDSLPYAAEFFAGLGDSQIFSHKDVNGELVADAVRRRHRGFVTITETTFTPHMGAGLTLALWGSWVLESSWR